MQNGYLTEGPEVCICVVCVCVCARAWLWGGGGWLLETERERQRRARRAANILVFSVGWVRNVPGWIDICLLVQCGR